MELKDLYSKYGELMVNAELIQGQINSVKQQINDSINTPSPELAPTLPESTPNN